MNFIMLQERSVRNQFDESSNYVDILKLKLCIINKRQNKNARKAMKNKEEMQQFKAERIMKNSEESSIRHW